MDQYFAYKITDAAGVLAYRAVVADGAGAVKKPAAAAAPGFIGFTQEAQATQNKSVNVQEYGHSLAVASAAITVGDRCDIADSTGKIRSCEAALIDVAVNPAEVVEVVCVALEAATADGDIIKVLIRPYTKVTPVS